MGGGGVLRYTVYIVHGPDRVTVHPPPPPPQDSLRPSFYCSLDLPGYQKSMPSKKKLGWTTCFGPFSKWPPSKSGNHLLCHNLSSKAARVTKLVSMYMFLGVRNQILPIKNVSVMCKIYKQLFQRIFRAFLVIFCVSPWDREGYCAPSTYESLKPSFFCSLDLPQYQKSMPSNKSRMSYLFGPFQNGRHWNLEITFCAITWVLRQLESQN